MKEVILSNIDLTKYVGQWVVICKNKIVGHNKNLNNMNEEIKSCKTTPKIVKIPKKDTLIF